MAFLIFTALVIMVLLIAFNNRDKSQDYKISSAYKQLSNEDRLKADLVSSLEKKIKSVINPAESRFNNGLLITGAIADSKMSFLSNKIDLAKQYSLTIYSTTEIIEECCLGAYSSYIK